MKVALFGKEFAENQHSYIQQIIDELVSNHVDISFYKPFFDKTGEKLVLPETYTLFNTHEDLIKGTDMLFSIGGDGTLLDTIPYVRGSGIPILGINLGRLGFLSSISKNEIKQALENIFAGKYYLDKRALLQLDKPTGLFGQLNFALNDLTIYRNNTTSLIVVHVYVDDKFLNSYWGDGLIVSTPTGSTAYSLSAGGPIVSPGSQNFVIAPIASHNLTVRPIVIQDSSVIRVSVGGREDQYLITMDSRHEMVNKEEELVIRRCDFEVNLVEFRSKDFFSTIRDKLYWGVDTRN